MPLSKLFVVKTDVFAFHFVYTSASDYQSGNGVKTGYRILSAIITCYLRFPGYISYMYMN